MIWIITSVSDGARDYGAVDVCVCGSVEWRVVARSVRAVHVHTTLERANHAARAVVCGTIELLSGPVRRRDAVVAAVALREVVFAAAQKANAGVEATTVRCEVCVEEALVPCRERE